MPTPTRAKPPISAWIIRERKRLGLKPRDLSERLSAAGLPVTEGTVRTWEAGRSPHPDNVEGLERIFGTRSPGFMGAVVSDDTSGTAALVTALTAQTAAISRLVEVLSRLTLPNAQEQAEMREALAEPVEGSVHRLGERLAGGDPDHVAEDGLAERFVDGDADVARSPVQRYRREAHPYPQSVNAD